MACDDVDQLARTIQFLQGLDARPDYSDGVVVSATAVLEEECRKTDAQAHVLSSLALLYQAQNRPGEAIQCYERALAQDYGNVRWRLRLARLLADTGAKAEAFEQAKICRRLRPEFEAAGWLIDELSRTSDATQ
jgi:tetratricopeptide (TPR) repeat protein